MKKVLFINACARPCSRSCELARHVLNRLPGQGEELRLYEEEIRPVDWPALQERVTRVTAAGLTFRYTPQGMPGGL